jgi:hypothetical protein
MKKIVRLMLATPVLLGAISTASFADGGAPPPMCSPGALRREGSRRTRKVKI